VYQNGALIGYELTITCSVVENITGSGVKGSVKKWYLSLASVVETAGGSGIGGPVYVPKVTTKTRS
jgi:hypothetical protein